MSLITQISDALTRIGTEFKTVYGQIGSLASLSTTAKGNVVAAINEVAGSVASGGGASINDTTPSTTSVYSSTKTTAVATSAANAAALALIADSSVSSTKTYSSQKISDAIAAAVTALIGGSPAALDTLKELADALGDDAGYAATITTALSTKLGFGAAQTLTAPQKVQGNANLGSLSLIQSGDPATDLTAVFTAALT